MALGTEARAAGLRASDIAYETLKRWIIRGDFVPREALDHTLLQQRLAVGRTPLREAIQRLAEDGLVRVVPHRGTFIQHVGMVDLKRVLDARIELEAACARLVALHPDEEKLAGLEELVRDPLAFAAPDDHRAPVHVLDELFHPLFYAASGNPFVETALLRLYHISTLSSNVLGVPRFSTAQVQQELEAILDAVRQRDPEAAAEAMRRHIRAFRYKIVEHFLGADIGRESIGGEKLR